MPTAYCPSCGRTWSKAPGKPCPVDGTPLQSIGPIEQLISGKLLIDKGTASLAGRKLARGGGDDPYSKAIEFLNERGLRSGDFVKIAGAKAKHKGRIVFLVQKADITEKNEAGKSVAKRQARRVGGSGRKENR